MNIIIRARIVFNMTYEEYKNNKNKVKNKFSFIRRIFSKLFTVIIFTMIIITISNYSPKFRNFLINEVLNKSMNFSKVNNLLDKVSNVYKKEETKNVSNIITNNSEKYKDGIKYFVKDNENVLVKNSGIITYIGNKEGYNNTVIVQQSNGFYAWYGNIKEKVKLYDYVEEGSVIGLASGEYYYVLLKDDKPVLTHEN